MKRKGKEHYDKRRLPVGALSSSQLATLITSGKHIEKCKREWKRRWGLEFPLWNPAGVVKSYIA